MAHTRIAERIKEKLKQNSVQASSAVVLDPDLIPNKRTAIGFGGNGFVLFFIRLFPKNSKKIAIII